MSSLGDESQMSGHADEAVGELQAGGVDGSSPPIPESTIKYSNGILLRGRGWERFPDASGQTLGVAGSSGQGRDFLRSRTEPVSLLPDRTSG